jgi:6-pyruvoyltetrahydropterin/6-carboxytetrahydropterin synthase
MVITRIYEVSAGHHLPLHEGKCREPHGHNYTIEVSVQGALQREGPASGMVMDFADLDKIVRQYLNVIDHQDLNTITEARYVRRDGTTMTPFPFPPTAEQICGWLFEVLQHDFPIYSAQVDGVQQLTRVRVYETRDSYTEVSR